MEKQKGQYNHNSNTTTTTTDEHQQSASRVFDDLRQEIGRINPHAETIELTYHLRKFAELFRRRITNDEMLNDLVHYLNEAALSDPLFAIRFATVFASRQLADASIYEAKVRNAMIEMLQQNFRSIERLKREKRFFNSVTLLGEYYHRKRDAVGKRINILGHSLFMLLTSELEHELNKACLQPDTYQFETGLARAVLSQVLLNGEEAKEDLKSEVQDLLCQVRKVLIEIQNISRQAKSFLLMMLDIHYKHLAGCQHLYSKYIMDSDVPDVTVAKQLTDSPIPANGVDETAGENGVESEQPNDTRKPAQRKRKDKQTKQLPAQPNASEQKSNGANTSGRSGKSSIQNSGINDKENKRRTETTAAVPVQKTSPKPTSSTDIRSIRLQEDGNIVASITRRDTQPTPATVVTSPTKNRRHRQRQPQQQAAPSNVPSRASTSSRQNQHVPRMEQLASSKRTQDKQQRSANSPRPVLGPSIAKQTTPHPPTTSSATDCRKGLPGSKHVPPSPPSGANRARHDRNDRRNEHRAITAEQRHRSNGSDALKPTGVDDQSSNKLLLGDDVRYLSPERVKWVDPLEHIEPFKDCCITRVSYPHQDRNQSKRTEEEEIYEIYDYMPRWHPNDPKNPENQISPLEDRVVNPNTASFLSFLTSDE